MHRLLGGDLIGMTAMPEAKLAREAEISYALVALVTDFDCWKKRPATEQVSDPTELMKEIVGNLQTATTNAMALIRKSIELAASREEILMSAGALRALELAIWSDKKSIAAEEITRLQPLWGRYL